MNTKKYTSLFLGSTLLVFGVLKNFSPFKEWVHIQITQSNLPQISFVLVIIFEIAAGFLFLLPFIFKTQLYSSKRLLLISADVIVIAMMSVAIYVHLQPNVPAYVLPLKIKDPYIPFTYIVIAFTNIYSLRKVRN